MKCSQTAFSNSNVNYFWSIKNSSEVIDKLRLCNLQGAQVSSFDLSTLNVSLPHALIKAKVLSLVNWCFNRESKSYICTSDEAGFFATKNMTHIDVGLAQSNVRFYFPHGKHICAIWWYGMPTNSGDSYGNYCKHILFARTLFSRNFAKDAKNNVLGNIFFCMDHKTKYDKSLK